MCLRTLPYGMVVIAGEVAVEDEDEDEDDDVGTVGVKIVGIPIVGDLGGLPEPGHLADSGPWLLIKPVAVVERDFIIITKVMGKTILASEQYEKSGQAGKRARRSW